MDKCMTCGNRIVASPECNGCDGEANYLAMRSMTKEESKNYRESLDKLFAPTGDNFFDL